MSKNRISRCLWLQAKMRLESPAAIGRGISEHTDHDLLLGRDGKPILPGASIAGVVRSLIREAEGLTQKDLNALFGDDCEEHRQSLITFWDGNLLENRFSTAIRDGIEINEGTKTAVNTSKYDFEVLNPGAIFRFRMEIVLREKDDRLPILQFVRNLIACIDEGDFRIGEKHTRGYGKISWEDIQWEECVFEGGTQSFEKYIDFQWETLSERDISDLPESTYRSPFTKIEVPLQVESTLLIRNYFLQNFDVDYEQLQVDERSVIPGSSWAGAFRHKVQELLTECADGNRAAAVKLTRELFGPEKKDTDPKKSRILFEESIDERKQGHIQNITRNKIDRFTGGVVKTGLFSERVGVGGEYRLKIAIRDAKDYEIGMILMVVQELVNGLMAIGGTTSVGRGVMRLNGVITMNQEEVTKEETEHYWERLCCRLAECEDV